METNGSLVKYDRLMVAADGSENSERAVKVAISLAKKFGTEVIICHVISIPSYATEQISAVNLLEAYFTAARKDAKKIMEGISRAASSQGVKTSELIIENMASIVEGIINAAVERKVDLIIVGTKGKSGFKRLLMGSVSSGVVNHANCSVLVVR